MVVEGLSHALPQFLLCRSRNECSSLQCWMVASLLLGAFQTDWAACFAVHVIFVSLSPSALNRCLASCDMPGNWF